MLAAQALDFLQTYLFSSLKQIDGETQPSGRALPTAEITSEASLIRDGKIDNYIDKDVVSADKELINKVSLLRPLAAFLCCHLTRYWRDR